MKIIAMSFILILFYGSYGSTASLEVSDPYVFLILGYKCLFVLVSLILHPN